MSTCTPPSRPWLRSTPNGLRASKTSRSVLATIEEAASTQAPGARGEVARCFSGTFGRSAASARMACSFVGDDARLSSGTFASPYSPVSPARPSLLIPPSVSNWSQPSPTTPRQTTQTLPATVDDESDSEYNSRDRVGVFGFRAVPLEDPAPSLRSIANSELTPSSPTSSRHTLGTDESHVQIVTAHPFRIHTAKARSHSIDQIKGLPLLSPESPAHPFTHRRPPPLDLFRGPPTPEPSPKLLHSASSSFAPGTFHSESSPLLPPIRSVSPLVVSASPSGSGPSPYSASPLASAPAPITPSSAPAPRRRIGGPNAIIKDFGALLEHINEDDTESHCSAGSSGSGLRNARNVNLLQPLPGSDAVTASLPPPPRPRNKALVRPTPHLFATPSISLPPSNSNLSRPHSSGVPLNYSARSALPPRPQTAEQAYTPTPILVPAPRTRSFSGHRARISGLRSLPLTPAAIPLPLSSTAKGFPRSPNSSHPATPYQSTPPSPHSPSHRSTFLPSCKSTIDSRTIKDDCGTPRQSDSTERANRSSSFSGFDCNFTHFYQRASGISFASSVSGSSARSPTDAECIPIGLSARPTQTDFGLVPLSPRSSLWRDASIEVDVQLPPTEQGFEDGTDESGSCLTEEEKEPKSPKCALRERARSLSAALPHLNISSLSKVDRVLGKGAARALIAGVHVHVPHLSLSSMSSESSSPHPSAPLMGPDPAMEHGATTEPHSFLPPGPPNSFIGMGGLGRKLSKKTVDPHAARRRSEEAGRVPSGGLMARMDRLIGRTPSPSARTKELEDETDEAPPPPPILPMMAIAKTKQTHGRKHSSSDPSAGVMRPRRATAASDRPATTNTRTAAERAEMLKKARKIQQLLGDVPSEDACEGAFYRNSRAARSEDLVAGLDIAIPDPDVIPISSLRVGGRRHSNPGSFADVLVISGDQAETHIGSGAAAGRVPSQNRKQANRGFHRPTASASSALSMLPLLPPMAPVSPGLISPDSHGFLSPGFSIHSINTASSADEEFGLGLSSPSSVPAPLSTLSVADATAESKNLDKPAFEDDLVSTLDELTLDDKTEDEVALARRAKRAKVAKLNRYLGSRIPAHLVLGMDADTWDYEQGLPEARSEDESSAGVGTSVLALGGVKRKTRRASEGDWTGANEDLGDLSVMSNEEKARAVRRKAKMEKMFGERPPQKLYQRHAGADTSAMLNDLSEESENDIDDGVGGAHYQSYRASFNSLAYFVNNADRDSLEGLYNIVSAQTEGNAGEEGEGDDLDEEQIRNQFAARRKRAAKLSRFFGVSYRDLFGAVLEILESDVKEDKEEGSLSAAETQDLLMKLRKLKAKGEDISV